MRLADIMRAGHFRTILLLSGLLIFSSARAQNVPSVNLPNLKESTYSLLSRISAQTGLMFVYDSELLDNSRVVRFWAGIYRLDSIVSKLSVKVTLSVKIEGSHALIYNGASLKSPRKVELPESDTIHSESTSRVDAGYSVLKGKVVDRISGEPIVFATLSVSGTTTAIVSNLNGEFRIAVPDSIKGAFIKISHLGYESTQAPLSLLAGEQITFYMDQRIIPLQEVVVKVVDPAKVMRDFVSHRGENYATDPVQMTLFYREGTEYSKSAHITESVLEIYKTGVRNTLSSEQVSLLKMRKIKTQGDDSLLAKVKSSIHTFQQLDIVKNLPDFLDPLYFHLYDYHHSDITYIDGRRVFVISFAQKPDVFDVLYTGELYFDAQTYALIRARFSLNKNFVRKAADILVIKRVRGLRISPEDVSYDVEYKSINGRYYLSHIRGDLSFNVKKRSRIFGSDLSVWFEMVNCNTDFNPKQIPQNERISPRDIFSETPFRFDPDFWGNMNYIVPEEEIVNLIKSKIKL